MARSRISVEELVVHRFYPLDLGMADEAYRTVLALWQGWQILLGSPILGTGLPIEPPGGLTEVPDQPGEVVHLAGQESANGGRQAILRRRNDVLILSVGFSGYVYDDSRAVSRRRRLPKRPGWVELDGLWQEMVGAGDDFLLGEARLYVATASALPIQGFSQPLAAAVYRRLPAESQQPAQWPAPARTTDDLIVCEVSSRVGAPILRRMVVLAPPGPEGDEALSAWAWSDGGLADPPLARYLLHAATLWREKRHRDRRGIARRGIGGPPAADTAAEAGMELALARADLLDRRRSVGIAADSMARDLAACVPSPPPRTLFAEDTALAQYLDDQMAGDIALLNHEEQLLRRTGGLTTEGQRRRPTGNSTPAASDPADRRRAADEMASGDPLDRCFGKAPAAALRAWAAGEGGTVELPLRGWRHVGPHTGAVLAHVALRRPRPGGGDFSLKLVVKVCPTSDDYENEAGRAKRAWDRSSRFAEKHFVRQPFGRYPVGDGRYLMFMEVAGNPLDVRTLADLHVEHLAKAYRQALELVLKDWNDVRDPATRRSTVREYLRTELRGALRDGTLRTWAAARGLLHGDTPWITVGGSADAGPNPFWLAERESVADRLEIDYLCGFSHGDLHLENVMVSVEAPFSRPMKLIDLSAYEENVPLTRDVATLLLSAVEPHVRTGLPPAAADELLELVVDGGQLSPMHLPPSVVGPVKAVHAVAGLVPDGLRPEWRCQFLLSVMAQALTHLTYDNVGRRGHWWCFRLAAGAARRLHLEGIGLGPAVPARRIDELAPE